VLPIVYHDAYSAPLPAGHRFPMSKFKALLQYLLAQGAVLPAQVHRPGSADQSLLQTAHTPGYVRDVLERTLDERSVRRIGFPLTAEVVDRSRAAVAGTALAARLAIRHGVAVNLAGGSHHAFADRGAGYCVFNDVAVAARDLLDRGIVSQVLVVDLDVHQGDGTAAICADDAGVFTFSMHGAGNFPVTKQRSDLDLELPDGTGDTVYLERLERALRPLLARLRPDLVFYNAGVDPHVGDRLGRLCLSTEGLRRRDHLVFQACHQAEAAVVGVLGGGYCEELDELVALHGLMVEAAGAAAGAIAGYQR
jgi:acetoin utilization deacetylase AcuC-like enzyme